MGIWMAAIGPKRHQVSKYGVAGFRALGGVQVNLHIVHPTLGIRNESLWHPSCAFKLQHCTLLFLRTVV